MDKFSTLFTLIIGIGNFIIGIIFSIVAIIFMKAFYINLIAVLIMSPFFIAFLAAAIATLSFGLYTILTLVLTFSNNKVIFYLQGKLEKAKNIFKESQKYLHKIYIIAFFWYWFSIIFASAYFLIKEKNYVALLFLLPFIIVGIFMIKKELFSKKKLKK